jgi:hypothetical protein
VASYPQKPHLEKIVSGGQTGVDRAALDVAAELGLGRGGWCPQGRLAEDGAIPARYRLAETATAAYDERTRLNVRDSDATLILNQGPLEGGSRLTADTARALGRPHRVVQLDGAPDPAEAAAWLRDIRPRVLNVAGPRESKAPGIAAKAAAYLRAALALSRSRS